MNTSAAQSDESLMLAYQAGSPTAFSVLYQRYQRMVFSTILRRVGWQHAIAEDITQSVWLKLIQNVQNYQVRASFKTYIFHIAHNVICDFYRRTNTNPLNQSADIDDPLTESLHEADGDESAHHNPEHLSIQAENSAALNQALQILPEHHRTILLYAYMAEMTVPEIATVMDIPLERAKSRLRYARQALKQALESSFALES